jgi:hypothetical protein
MPRLLRSDWLPLVLLALAWGVGPALPALVEGQLLGQPYTDLYPSVWGLWGFAQAQPGLPDRTELLGFPAGMGFYYSSPIKGWLATPLLPLIGVPATFNLLTVSARVAGVLLAGAAARAWGAGRAGALTAAAIYGCAPFFQGYAVEGIIEGTDGWTLALWALLVGRGRYAWAIVALALTALSSWYLGMATCLLAVLAMLKDWRASWSLLGLVLVLPALYRFGGAFPGVAPLDPLVRAAMGASLHLSPPGILGGVNPFAMTTWIGVVAPLLAIAGHPRLAALALVPLVLSLGRGPLYDLPVLELVRFPYRWHAATLAILALAAARTADRRGWSWLGPLVVVEGLLLSPIEPVLPGSDATIPALYSRIDGPVLELPGPVGLPPGEVNPSRQRARYVLYHQSAHGQPSPWVPDFNSVGVEEGRAPWLPAFAACDVLLGNPVEECALDAATVDAARGDGLRWIVLQHRELGSARVAVLRQALLDAGAELDVEGDGLSLLRLNPN